MFSFAWAWCLLLLIVPFILHFLRSKKSIKTQEVALKVPFFVELESISNQKSQTQRSNFASLFLYSIWILLVIALARPQLISETQFIQPQGYDLMLAVDTSGSMEIEDLEWNGYPIDRYSMIKRLFVPFIESRQGDRLGLLFFGSYAYLQAPLTKDRQTIKKWLDESFIGLAGTQTAIGDGLALSVKKLTEDEQTKNPIIILLTDGANNSGQLSPEIAAEIAQKENIKVYAIGLGSDKLIQTRSGAVSASYDLDEKALQNIAEKTGGKYFRARTNEDLLEITKAINQLEPIEQPHESVQLIEEYYDIPLALALLLTLGFLIYRWRK